MGLVLGHEGEVVDRGFLVGGNGAGEAVAVAGVAIDATAADAAVVVVVVGAGAGAARWYRDGESHCLGGRLAGWLW